MKVPMKSISFVPKNVPGGGGVRWIMKYTGLFMVEGGVGHEIDRVGWVMVVY